MDLHCRTNKTNLRQFTIIILILYWYLYANLRIQFQGGSI